MGLVNRRPSPAELSQMRDVVDASTRQGALGLPTGLE
jgi:N-acyl-D-aspartate/D-glutamate deacylase